MAPGPDYMTAADAAVRLGVSPQMVGKLIRGGTLAATKIGRTWFIKPADLARVPAERKPGPKPAAASGKPNRRRSEK